MKQLARQNPNATIYGLFDPRNGNLCYIGRTQQSLQGRLRHHLYDAVHGYPEPRYDWMRELLGLGPRTHPAALRPPALSVAEAA